MASEIQKKRATLEDLYRVDGKAELIGGRIVRFPPAGHLPSLIAAHIYCSLDEYSEMTGRGEAHTSTIGFAIPELSSGRESFSPDASYYEGPRAADGMDFIPGPPTFAVEVRSKGDHGPAAEAKLAAKRADYFEAGTRVVWDVDPRNECIRAYRPEAPEQPATFEKGQLTDAEPAVPGWRIAVEEIFA